MSTRDSTSASGLRADPQDRLASAPPPPARRGAAPPADREGRREPSFAPAAPSRPRGLTAERDAENSPPPRREPRAQRPARSDEPPQEPPSLAAAAPGTAPRWTQGDRADRPATAAPAAPHRGGEAPPPPVRPRRGAPPPAADADAEPAPRRRRDPPPPGGPGGPGQSGGSDHRDEPPRKRRWLRRLMGWGISAGIWGALAVVAVGGYYATDLPDLDSLTATTRRPSVVFQGETGEVIASYGDIYGEPLDVKDLPPTLPQAVMSTEDRHFYSHFGLDLIGLGRAAVVNLRAGHVVQGGSTLTQQLAKNLFLTPERSFKRKVQELLISLWLERKFTKDQIITLYLNRVYLGAGTYGVDAAAKRYFGTSARTLSLYQSALLAGLLKAPSRYNPVNDPELSAQRTSQVLKNMVTVGYITEGQADEARRLGPGTVKKTPQIGRYFADWIHDQVDSYSASGQDLIVRTTLNPPLQRFAEQAVETLLAGPGGKAGASQAAVVVMRPDGAIVAMVGGRSYAASQFNRAVQGLRQPGSSFKPFVYLTALEQGWTPDTLIDDLPMTGGSYHPENYSGKYEGAIPLRQALAKSSNVAAVRLIEHVGPRKVVATARRLGITSPLHPEASLALGTSEVTLLQLTAAYASFANDGYGVFPYGYTQIRSGTGQDVYVREGGGTGQTIAPAALRGLTDMMSAVLTEGTGKADALDRPAAGKTGTTQDYRDAWFVGFTADYVCGVWLGNDDSTPMHKVTGGGLPGQLWKTVMMSAHKGMLPRPLPGLTVPDADVVNSGDGVLTGPGAGDHAAAPGVVPSGGDDSRTIWESLSRALGGGR